jgi:CDP-glucose 4,6-dehydratase
MMFDNIYRGKRVLVTGHTGFKGSWLSEWLISLGAEVSGFSLPPACAGSHFERLGLEKRMRHFEGDLRDAEALGKIINEVKPEIVFHLAAQALVREAYADPKATFDINIGGAVNLLEAVRKAPSVRALVFITSDKCYRNVNWEWGYRETDTLGGRDPYSASKGCAEIVFDAYWNSFLKGKIHAASARAGNVIGGGDWAKDRLIPDCVRFLRAKETIVIRSPEATRPWQHVLEPLGGYLLLGRRLLGEDGENFCKSWNFGPGHSANRTVEEVVRKVIALWGSGDLSVQKDPNAPHEDHWLQLNTDRASHYLHWEPVWMYQESITETVHWYRAWHEGAEIEELTRGQIAAYEKLWQDLGRP